MGHRVVTLATGRTKVPVTHTVPGVEVGGSGQVAMVWDPGE